jgi:hypothetical protein
MSQQLPDVYTNSDIDNFPGGELALCQRAGLKLMCPARERSRPGEADREETYPMTHDACVIFYVQQLEEGAKLTPVVKATLSPPNQPIKVSSPRSANA